MATGAQPTDQCGLNEFNHMKVEIGIKCAGLINKDVGSLSDPIAFLYQRSSSSNPWALVGRTEMIKNTLNPQFATKIHMNYIFEATQQLKVEIYDVDNEMHLTDPSKQDFLGSAETDIAAVVSSEGMSRTLPLVLKSKKEPGTVTLLITEEKECHDVVLFRFSCRKLAKMNTFSSDPFFTIERVRRPGEYEVIYKSTYYKKELNPKFPSVKLPLTSLCNGNIEQPFRIRVWDYESSGKHNLIGIIDTTIPELTEKREIEIRNPEAKKEKDRAKGKGTFIVEQCEVTHIPSFMEYIRSGLRFHLSIAVDFTGSNGDPRSPSSLHYMNPSGAPNEYVMAISAIADILTKYIGHNQILASGFGACIPPSGNATHLFPLSLDDGNYLVNGVPELIAKYASVLGRVIFSGPTNFAPTIKSSRDMATQLMTQRPYDFLVQLIITDGEITDMDHTISEIVEASRCPMSIIIIGVGGSSFANMDRLDADDSRLSSGGQVQAFDNVQFVPFRNYAGRPMELAAQVLAELPGQVVEYMSLHKIAPAPAPKE